MVGSGWKYFHHTFLSHYVPKFYKAAVEYFENAPDVEIRKFDKELLDKTICYIGNLLRRVYSLLERCKIVERLELLLATILLQSNYLQRRIDGLKALNEIIKNVITSISKVINAKFLSEWIIKNKLIDEFFGKKRHQQILQRSGPIVSFMYSQNLLEKEIMEEMWENVQDDQLRPDILKIIQDINFPINSQEFKFYVDKISNMSSEIICVEALDVIFESRKTAAKYPEQLLNYAAILENLMVKTNYPLNVREQALVKYADRKSVV